MNIDLLPFSAFALESSSATGASQGDAYTLTLQLELATVHDDFEPAMSGNITFADGVPSAVLPLRASVVPADGPVLTITF